MHTVIITGQHDQETAFAQTVVDNLLDWGYRVAAFWVDEDLCEPIRPEDYDHACWYAQESGQDIAIFYGASDRFVEKVEENADIDPDGSSYSRWDTLVSLVYPGAHARPFIADLARFSATTHDDPMIIANLIAEASEEEEGDG